MDKTDGEPSSDFNIDLDSCANVLADEPKRAFDAWLALRSINIAARDTRRDHEQKVTAFFWTGLAGAAVFGFNAPAEMKRALWSGTPVGLPLCLFLGLGLLAFLGIHVWVGAIIQRLNGIELRRAHEIDRALYKILLTGPPERNPPPRPIRSYFVLYRATTSALLAVLVIAAWWLPAKADGKQSHEMGLTRAALESLVREIGDLKREVRTLRANVAKPADQ